MTLVGGLTGGTSNLDDCRRDSSGVHHGAAVDLTLSCGMLGDVADPQLVETGAGEAALNEVVAGGDGFGLAGFRRAQKANECPRCASAARPGVH